MQYQFYVAVPDDKMQDEDSTEELMDFIVKAVEYMQCEMGGQAHDFILDTLHDDVVVSETKAKKLADTINMLTEYGVLHSEYKEGEDEPQAPPTV